LSNRAQSGEQDMSFDKDDKDTLDFVSAAANLRSHVFGIPTNSEWEIKQMAGNIIPAIATSNALTASLSVMLSYKVLRSKVGRSEAMAKPTANNSLPTTILSGKDESPLGGSKMVFLNSKSTERVITTQGLGRPDSRCPVCSPVYARLRIPKDTKPTLGHLVDEISAKLKYEEFQISTTIGVVYEPDLDDNLPRALSDLGVDLSSNGFITVTDDSDEPRVDLILSTSPHLEERGGIELDLGDLQELPYKSKAIVSANDLRIGDTSISDVMPMENTLQAMETATTNGHSEKLQDAIDDASVGSKRKRNIVEDMQIAHKRAKPEAVDVEAHVGGSNGAIILDDD
jgi:ubiquitin-like 1-activating enzyme E1 B